MSAQHSKDQQTIDQLVKTITELHALIGVSMSLSERCLIQKVVWNQVKDHVITQIQDESTNWLANKGIIRTALAANE